MKAKRFDNPSIFNSRYGVWICIFIVAATLSVYFQVRHFDFVNYDTPEYVYDNRNVRQGLSVEGLNWALTATYMSNWHPITWLSHMLDVTLFGLSPGPHHLMSLAIHILNAVLLFILLLNITEHPVRSGLVAALFALHPLHVQSVVWVAERKDLLSTLFFFLSIISYVQYVKKNNIKGYFAVLIFFILGLMSKPMIVTLPFVLLLMDFWPLRRIDPYLSLQGKKPLSTAFVFDKIPLFVLSGVSSIITLFAQQSGGAVASFNHIPFRTRLANALVSYLVYLNKLFWPDNLAAIYPYPEQLSVALVVFSIACFAVISLLSFKLMKSRPWFIVGWLWFVITLVPVIGIVQVGMQPMADRYTYIPSVGIFIIMSWTLFYLLERHSINKENMVPIALSIISVYSVVSWQQVGHWKDSKTLFEHAISVTKNNFIAHNNLGHHLLENNDLESATLHFERAIQINPNFETAHLNLGISLSRKGRFDNAIEHYKTAIEINPEYSTAYSNLGNAYFRKNELKRAIPCYLQALKLEPDFSDAYSNLGAVMVRLGDNEKAFELFRNALKLDPENKNARQNLQTLISVEKQARSLEK
jgi:tetratricopeptide (TPR) repeat protein